MVQSVELVEQPQWLYNLTVAEAHTFFVGQQQWLVHNHCGAWVKSTEYMSERAAAYQARVTGRTGQIYLLDGIKFDGFVDGVLLDAKGPGYAAFVDKNGLFKPWWNGKQELLDEASRQIGAAAGRHPIEWHVAEESAANAMRNLLQSEGFGVITVRHKP